MNADIVRIAALQVETIIGVLPHERTDEQPLVIELEVELDLTRAALHSDLDSTVNYAQLTDEAVFIVQAGRFKLLESAALALCHYLLTPPIDKDLAVAAARVTLSKPQALGGRAMPSVSVRRRSEQVRISEQTQGEARVVRIYETDEVGLLRLHRWTEALPATGLRTYCESRGMPLTADARLVVLR